MGLSLRDLQEALRVTLGEVRSLEACHRLVFGWAKRVTAWTTRRVEAPPPVGLVDGCWVKRASPSGEVRTEALGRRRAVKRTPKRVVCTALGVWPDGHGAIVDGTIAPQEDAEAWQAFVGEL